MRSSLRFPSFKAWRTVTRHGVTITIAIGLALGACQRDSSTPTAPSGKRAACTLGADQSCNEDPRVSALWGRCTELGVCECKAGFERSPTTDLCRPAAR
jgi:hypothetical protein